jgi:hypothetical protein
MDRLFHPRGLLIVFVLLAEGRAGLPQSSSRFVDNLDGTLSDKMTGLMWEKKTLCAGPSPSDSHCVSNEYEWTKSGNDPDGSLFTDFLSNINREDGRNKYHDWRIPTIDELEGIASCANPDCLDPVFGPTQASRYWSSTPYADARGQAWTLNFFNGAVNFRNTSNSFYARAVRGGRS